MTIGFILFIYAIIPNFDDIWLKSVEYSRQKGKLTRGVSLPFTYFILAILVILPLLASEYLTRFLQLVSNGFNNMLHPDGLARFSSQKRG